MFATHRANFHTRTPSNAMHMSRPLTAAIDTVRTAWLAPTRVHPRRVARLVTAPAAAADTTGSDAEYFTQSFKRLLQTMQSAGVVPASPSLEDTADETGDIKRALLVLARTRPQYLAAMDQDTLSALASLPLEIEERKVRMAQQRLQASYVQGKDLDVKHGGAASLQDVLRLLQSLQGGQPVQPDAYQAGTTLLNALEAMVANPPADLDYAVEYTPVENTRRARDDFGDRRGRRGDFRGDGRGDFRGDGRRSFSSSRRRDSYSDSSKPGDWECPECGFSNFASRGQCFSCAAPHPDGGARAQSRGRPDDWTCPECQFSNHSYRSECKMCSTPNPTPSQYRERGGRQQRNTNSDARKGDWDCPQCGFLNFSFRSNCVKCGEQVPAGMGRGAPPKQISVKEGDWKCSCSVVNFAYRTACFRCGDSKSNAVETY